jgi:4-alpha-glucanotransferase
MSKRTAGILMPIFSLPGKYGIGTLGKAAYRFADFLKKSGQSYWQILPIGPTGYGDSPYQSFSCFAGNPYFIDLEMLEDEGLLRREECEDVDFGDDSRQVEYDRLFYGRFPLLLKAYERFLQRSNASAVGSDAHAEYEEFQIFCVEQAYWLDGYATFMAKKDNRFSADYYRFLQYKFRKQWNALRKYVNGLGIQIIGDIPIYVSADSSDVVDDPKLFQLTQDGTPKAVAGCPPDAFAEKGQLWGNPLYDWKYHESQGYAWWIRRVKYCLGLYDVLRIDHFRGFDEYYSIPFGDKDATGGHWEKGPGMGLFRAIQTALPDAKIIAEDLGFVTASVRKLVKDSGFPGMKVLQFAFDSRESEDYRPCTWPKHSIAYTGTHDNQTLKSWLLEISEDDQKMVADALHMSVKALLKSDYVKALIRMTLDAAPDTAIVPLQDYLELDRDARINTPSTLGGNWSYRFLSADFDDTLAAEIRNMTEESRRDGKTDN